MNVLKGVEYKEKINEKGEQKWEEGEREGSVRTWKVEECGIPKAQGFSEDNGYILNVDAISTVGNRYIFLEPDPFKRKRILDLIFGI